MISEPEWESIAKLAAKVAAEISGSRRDYFITGKVVKVDEKNKCIYLKEFADQAIPMVYFDYDVKYYDETPRNTDLTAQIPIDTTGIGTLSGNFTADGQSVLIIASGGGYAATDALIGMDVKVDGSVIGSSTTFTNESNSHKQFATMQKKITPTAGSHTLSFHPTAGTIIDANDHFVGTVIGAPAVKTRVKTVRAIVVMPKRGDTVLVAREMGTSRLPRCFGVIQGKNWITAGAE